MRPARMSVKPSRPDLSCRWRLPTCVAVIALAVTGCTNAPVPVSNPVAAAPVAAIAGTAPIPRPAPVQPQVSEQSRLLAIYYQRLQNDLVSRGLIRTDGGGPDTPFTDTQLAANFVQIALHDEYATTGNGLTARTTDSALRRWSGPVRFSVEFGASVPEATQQADTAFIRNYVARLGRLTGLQTGVGTFASNFHVLILNEDERLASADRLRQLVPGIDNSSVRYAVNLPRDQLCVVIGTFQPDGVTYRSAVAIIRAEHPDLLRQTCVHEELAQGLGLANDSPRARPSIFNDDEEFGFLTRQDELLLRLLYDPRLMTGMTEQEAGPIVRQIATELMGGPV